MKNKQKGSLSRCSQRMIVLRVLWTDINGERTRKRMQTRTRKRTQTRTRTENPNPNLRKLSRSSILVEAEETESQPLAVNEIDKVEIGTSSRFEVVRRLSLSEIPPVVTDPINSELGSGEHEIVKRTVEPTAKMLDPEKLGPEKGKEKVIEGKDKGQWANMFRNNRAAQNCMNLSYFPPQIVDGHTAVQLDEEGVQSEEDKWKCVLIVYVVGEC